MTSLSIPSPLVGPPVRADDGSFLARALVGACAPPAAPPTPWQRVVVEAACVAATGRTPVVPERPETTPAQIASRFRHHPATTRSRLVRLAFACTLTVRPIQDPIVDRVLVLARALRVDEDALTRAFGMTEAAFGLLAVDFDRHGYVESWRPVDRRRFHAASSLASSWELGVHDDALAARWQELEHLPGGSLGRAMWEFHAVRGLSLPGTPGSAPLMLAQHDWIHVLADFGTTPSSELEVWALTAAGGDDVRLHVLLAMAIVLNEWSARSTDQVPGEMVPWHPCSASNLRERLADAMHRGARCRAATPRADLSRVDWLAQADRPLDEVRACFGIPPKSDRARRAGSTGAADPVGPVERAFAVRGTHR